MNKIYDNGEMVIGELDLVINYIEKNIEDEDDSIELLNDLKELKKDDVKIVCVDYDNGMGYSIDYWHVNDEVQND